MFIRDVHCFSRGHWEIYINWQQGFSIYDHASFHDNTIFMFSYYVSIHKFYLNIAQRAGNWGLEYEGGVERVILREILKN